MKKKLITFVSSVMPFLVIADTAKITVAVCSAETGDPIENVRVTAWFENSIGWRAWSLEFCWTGRNENLISCIQPHPKRH